MKLVQLPVDMYFKAPNIVVVKVLVVAENAFTYTISQERVTAEIY